MSNVSRYEIQGWDPVLAEPEQPLAMVFVKPDLKLLQIFNDAPMKNTLVKITGSGSGVYDDKIVWGTIDKSSDVPNCRQNIFNCNGLYAITLDIIWMGYPLNNGSISFVDGVIDKIESLPDSADSLPESLLESSSESLPESLPENKQKNKQKTKDNEEKKGYTTYTCLWIVIVVLILFGLYLYRKKERYT
jgi:hypothetical protein